MKLILRDPLPLEALRERLRQFHLRVTPERDKWLGKHHEHANLQLEPDRFYCRTCKESA